MESNEENLVKSDQQAGGVSCISECMESTERVTLPPNEAISESESERAVPINALPPSLVNRIKGVIYGNCIGDAIGLLTEFMSKQTAHEFYKPKSWFKIFSSQYNLEYHKKVDDPHRSRWKEGDWTDDSDQMLLILLTLVENDGQFIEKDFASRLLRWSKKGYPELGDYGGMGMGMTTGKVLRHRYFLEDPHKAAYDVWEKSGYNFAPNGGVMRTSILGTMQFDNLDKVVENTKSACKVSHADPRCIASCVAVTVAIALMMQGHNMEGDNEYNADEITQKAYEYAEKIIENEEHKRELKQYMFEKKLKNLDLDGSSSIGYTFKCLGAGFWAFRQKNFRDAIENVTMEAGDADTNCAVAGALLGCKLGFNNLPESWHKGLCHRDWLDNHVNRYLNLLADMRSKQRESSDDGK